MYSNIKTLFLVVIIFHSIADLLAVVSLRHFKNHIILKLWMVVYIEVCSSNYAITWLQKTVTLAFVYYMNNFKHLPF